MERESFSFQIGETTLHFPYEHPYGAQKVIMTNALRAFARKENALLESPTGTGKSLALLAAALAYQERTYLEMKEVAPPGTVVNKIAVWFASRTHTQLKQLVGELKRLPYQPSMTIIGARSHFCAYDKVKYMGNVEYNCRMEKHNCPYAQNGNSVPDDLANAKFDIEELAEACQKKTRCGFLVSREMLKTADLILCPYNYVTDPKVRGQMNVAMDGAIVIIDEAHNIEDMCRQAARFDISYDELGYVKKELERAIGTTSGEGTWLARIKPLLEKTCEVFGAMLEWFETRRKYWDGSGVDVPEKHELTTLGGWKLNSRGWPKLEGAILELTKKDKGSGSRLPDRMIQKLNEFLGTMRLVFGENSSRLHDFRIVYHRANEQKYDGLAVLCMNPAIAFAPLSRITHSIILSSGTLSPFESFASELGTPFEVRQSTAHVINSCQVMASVVRATDDGLTLSSSYSHLQMADNRDRTFLALGVMMTRLLKCIPGGAIMFVPSQDFLNRLIEKWRSSRLWDAICAIKPIFFERKNAGKDVIASYKHAVDSGLGGLLIGWYRGGASEGIDFADSQARAVFAFGIPYPSYTDIDIQLKKTYNDEHSKAFINNPLLSANEWYDAQAFRSVSQAIGRCVRHKNDYGSIILIDDKYANQIGRLPAWLRESTAVSSGLSSLSSSLHSFFQRMAERFPDSKVSTLNLDAPSILCCCDCGSRIIELYRFDARTSETVEKRGMLSILGLEDPVPCLIVQKSVRKQVFVQPEAEFWRREDNMVYKTIVCECGSTVGVHAFLVSEADPQYFGAYLMVADRLVLSQGSHSVPILTITNS